MAKTLVAGLFGKSRSNLDKAIAKRLPFTTSGALKGDIRKQTIYGAGRGMLNSADYDMLKADLAIAGQTFIVWSYDTPIAWTRPDGTLYVTPQRFSPTTTRHQGAVRGADAIAKAGLSI